LSTLRIHFKTHRLTLDVRVHHPSEIGAVDLPELLLLVNKRRVVDDRVGHAVPVSMNTVAVSTVQ
jgi:hypothetical protein